MKGFRFFRVLFLLVMAAVVSTAAAQENVLVNISYDPHADSVFFAKMNKKMAQIRKKRPTVAVVLAGGGAKGAAHIGVLRYLEEKGIPVDFIAGTSMGALIGGLYSMGYSAAEIDTITRSIDWNVMMSDKIPMEYYSYKGNSYKRTYQIDIPFDGGSFLRSLPSGYLYGLNVYNLLSMLSVGFQQDVDFTELPTPFCCIAAEIVTQTEKRWTHGSMIDAMRSTMSIPGYFRPVRIDSMILSDGGTKNNFPTDIAKAAGADIIIGVELTMPRDYSKVNNVADILIQTTQYSGSLEAHNRNVKNATVYITPDISGYSTLSFGANEIATLIGRGYRESEKHADEIDKIAAMVGTGGRQLHNKHALNISKDKVKLNAVEINGVTMKERSYINTKLRLKIGEYYDRSEFEIDQSIIYGTMAFSDVTYRLLEEADGGYRLVFNCNKRPKNSMNIGVRADSEEWFAALLNVGFGRNRIYGSEFDIMLRLSTSPYLKVQYIYQPFRGAKFGASWLLQYKTTYGSNNRSFTRSFYEQYFRSQLKIFMAGTRWSRVDLNGGVKLEYLPFHRSMSENGLEQTLEWNKIHHFLYVDFVFDNEDNHYFPTHGLAVSANYNYNLKKTHYAEAGVRGTISVCDFFHIIPSLHGRYIFGQQYDFHYMKNYLGGTMAGRHYDHQIPFIGMNGDMMSRDYLTIIDADFRFRVRKNFYLSLVGAAMHDGMLDDSRKLDMREHGIYAAAVKFGYNSKLGPLFTNIHWNSYTKKVGLYVGWGYDF